MAMAVREMAVSIGTGAINSVISKLNDLLGDKVSSLVGKALLGKQVKFGIQYLRNELSSMKAVLLRLSDMEEHMDLQTKEWRDRVRDMSFEIEDCIDRFVQRRRSHGSTEGDGIVPSRVEQTDWRCPLGLGKPTEVVGSDLVFGRGWYTD